MEDYKKEFIEFMIDCEVLKFGDFVTKSGRKTPFFVNTGFYRTGAQLRRLGQYYARAIKETFGTDFNVLFGPAYKGIPLTVAATMSISEMYDADIRYCYHTCGIFPAAYEFHGIHRRTLCDAGGAGRSHGTI